MKKIIFLTLFVLFTFVAYGDNLQWSTTSYSDYEAKLYCENLREEGYKDWRLPTISELRTLIQNCPATETGGECKITDTCRSWTCYADACTGCNDFNEHSKLGGKGIFWSSSDRPDLTGYAWAIDFQYGKILSTNYSFGLYDTVMLTSVRCVRNAPLKKEPPKTKILSWSNKAPNKMDYNDAVKYCKNLKEEGVNKWHLPTISELRTLIKNCPTASDGPCGVTDKCLSADCVSNSKCGPCRGNLSKLGDKGWVWSSSMSNRGAPWTVRFDNGTIDLRPGSNHFEVRCVGEENNNVTSLKSKTPTETEIKNNHSSSKTLLSWSNSSPNTMNWNDAVNYCKNLNEGGHNDWRLPTISELRTLIKNCKKTETDGECKVSDSCSSYSCRNDACLPCGENHSGKYSKLGDKNSFWSSSVRSDNSDRAWLVHFSYGDVFDTSKSSIYSYIRCVRNPE